MAMNFQVWFSWVRFGTGSLALQNLEPCLSQPHLEPVLVMKLLWIPLCVLLLPVWLLPCWAANAQL